MRFPRELLDASQAIQSTASVLFGPPQEGRKAPSEQVVLVSLVQGTRGYIERIVNQINGTYDLGWYDACSVMIRRLLETLIIEAFEYHQIADKIKNDKGDFLYLNDLVTKCLAESMWNLGRNSKKALLKLKDVGDKSAHSRRFNAQRGDLEPLLVDIRDVVQELIYLSGLMADSHSPGMASRKPTI